MFRFSRGRQKSRYVILASATLALAGVMWFSAAQPSLKLATGSLVPLATYPGAATSEPSFQSPLSLPQAKFPNSSIESFLDATGKALYVPPSGSSPAITEAQAIAVAAKTAFYGSISAPRNATLVLLQFKLGSQTPVLAWVVDCTPSQPVADVAPHSGSTPSLLHFWVVVVEAQGPQAGGVMFQQGG